MNNIFAKYFVAVVCVFHFFQPLSAQNDTPVLINRDTISFEGELICRKSYKCDGDYRYYIETRETTPQIKEIVYSDGILRSRYFIRIFPDIDYIRIDYNNDGNVAYSYLSFQIEYKNIKYVCPVSSSYFYDKRRDIRSSLDLQNLQGHLIAEYSCYNNGKWEWTPYHKLKPPKYAKKLFKIFLSQYQDKLYLLEKCIRFEQ